MSLNNFQIRRCVLLQTRRNFLLINFSKQPLHPFLAYLNAVINLAISASQYIIVSYANALLACHAIFLAVLDFYPDCVTSPQSVSIEGYGQH